MDWTLSGITHEWQYQLVDSATLTARGWLDGVKGGKLTEAYRGETRSQLALDLDGSEIPLGSAVRVWHVATYGEETVRECMGTFHPEPAGGKYEYGRMTSSVTLYSSLMKLKTTKGKQVRSVGKVNVINHFKEIVPWALAVPYVAPSWQTGKNFADGYVWQMPSESIYAEAQRCADAIGGYLGVDVMGKVTLTPYKKPSSLPESFWLLPGTVVHFGVDVDVPELVNRIVAKHEKDGKTYTSVANLDASHPWSKESIGRIVAEELTNVTIQDGSSIQTQLDKATKQALEERKAAKRTFTVQSNYDSAARCGAAGHLTYNDITETINAKVFCSGREIQLDHTADMSLTLEEL